MRILPAAALLFALQVSLAGEAPEEVRPKTDPAEYLARVHQRRGALWPQLASYAEYARGECFRIVLSHPESPQARQAIHLLLELHDLDRILGVESDPTRGLQANAATKMFAQAEQYADVDKDGMLRSAVFLYREIIRRHPETRQAVDAARRLVEYAPAFSVQRLWGSMERQAARGDRDGLLAAERTCQDIIRRYPESPQAAQAAKKMLEFSAALKNMPDGGALAEAGEENPSRRTPGTGNEQNFFFYGEDEPEWVIPNPDELYRRPEKRTESLEPLPRSAVTRSDGQ